MTKRREPGREELPITGEVGSEGGSYADSTIQVPTFTEDLGVVAEDAEPEKVNSDGNDVIRFPHERAD